MLNKRSPSARLLLALVLSMLLHVLMLSGVNLEMPDWFVAHDNLDVVLLRPEPQKPIKRPPQQLAVKKVIPHRTAQPGPVAAPVPETTESQGQKVAETPQQLAPAEPEQQAVETATEAAHPAPEVEESLATRGFKHAELEYRLFRGQGSSVGTVKYEYHQGGEGNYSITATAEASGLVSLFVHGKYVQQSEGLVTSRGLRPLHFSYRRGGDANKDVTATFDWGAGKLNMENGQKFSSMPLQEGVQDQLSFMYQFMFVPPLEQMQLAITNGKRLRTYFYQFDGEDVLKTDIGDVRALHISKRDSDGEGKLELWLAPDYRYLPVKISQTESDGKITEQLIKQLKAE